MSDTQNVKLGVCTVSFGGVDLGLTKGGVEVTVTTETHEVTVDQYGNTPINEYITSRKAEVKVPMAESTLENIEKIMPGAKIITDATDTNKKYVSVPTGIGVNLLDLAQELVLHPVANEATDKSEDFTLFKAGTAGELNYSYKLDEERIFNCTFKGYADESGKLFAIGDTTATA